CLLDSVKDERTGNMSHVLPSSQEDYNAKIKTNLLSENDPSSLVVAVLMCLQACPRDLAAEVASNMVFCGDAVALLPDLPRQVTKKVEELLKGGSDDSAATADSIDATTGPVFGMVPIDMKRLRPLALQLTLRSCAPFRADLVSWIGASLFAASWNTYDEDETPIPWLFPPSRAAGDGTGPEATQT
ncbi:MAG: hypothetical protein SGARI_007930, partial [Bacillariaceae sp.]